MRTMRSLGLMGALAAVSIGLLAAEPMPQRREPPPPVKRKVHRKAPRFRSEQKPAHERLILDRSSSVKKLRRWIGAGGLAFREPDQRELMRHGWYRRQKEREARAAATEAWSQS